MQIRIFLLSLACTLCSLPAFAQNGRVFVIRPGNYNGAAVPVNVYLDQKLVCKLKNKHFSVHEVTGGTHTIAVQSTGLSLHTLSAPDTLHIEAGKDVYLKLQLTNGKLSLKELTQFSADYDMKNVSEMTKCLKD